MGKTNFNMQLTDTQKELMDFSVDVIFSEYKFSKANLVSMLVKKSALDYLNMFDEKTLFEISDEQLLFLLKQEKRNKDMHFINMIGLEKYKAMIKEGKEKYPDSDYTYMDGLIAEYEKNNGGNING